MWIVLVNAILFAPYYPTPQQSSCCLDRHSPNPVSCDYCLSNGHISKLPPNSLFLSRKVRRLAPFKAATTVFKEVKAFIREKLEETWEPRVGELPNKLSLLWGTDLGNRKLKGWATALARFYKCYMRVSLSSSLTWVLCGALPHLPGVRNFGQITYLFVPQFLYTISNLPHWGGVKIH